MWYRARHTADTRVNLLKGRTLSHSPVSTGHTEQCLREPPSHPPQTKLNVLGHTWTSMKAEQENKNSDCQLPFSGPWQVLQFNREMSSHEALMCQLRSLSGLQTVTFGLQRPRTQNSILRGLSAGLAQAGGLPGDMAATGTGKDGVKCPPLGAVFGLRLAGVVDGCGFHSFF